LKNAPEIWTYRYRQAPAPAPPLPPADLTALTEARAVRLTWKPGVPQVREYRVYRSRQPEEPWKAEWARLGVTREPRYEDRDLAPSSGYLYRVTAVAADGTESRPS